MYRLSYLLCSINLSHDMRRNTESTRGDGTSTLGDEALRQGTLDATVEYFNVIVSGKLPCWILYPQPKQVHVYLRLIGGMTCSMMCLVVAVVAMGCSRR